MSTTSQQQGVKDNGSLLDGSYFDYDYSLEEASTKSWETFSLLGIFALSFFMGVGGHLYLLGKRCWRQEKERGLFLLSSMAADLILLCLVMPLVAVAMYKGEWPFGGFICEYKYFIISFLIKSRYALVSTVSMHVLFLALKF